VEASTEGVLGGYGCVNDVDVKGSDAFLRPLLAERFGHAKRRLVALGKLGSARGILLLLLSV
jgi:protein N-terminal methyltransferase